jgi:hypothetical protein
MDKIKIGSTYGYTNFINAQEQQELLEWVDQNQSQFRDNGNGRKFGIIQQIQKQPHPLVSQLRDRIVELENIKDFKPEPIFQDYVGINSIGASIHPHTDVNQLPYIHTRFNVVLSYPDVGGESVYGDEINPLQELLVWKCIAGKVTHASTPVISGKPRITLSLGFLIND